MLPRLNPRHPRSNLMVEPKSAVCEGDESPYPVPASASNEAAPEPSMAGAPNSQNARALLRCKFGDGCCPVIDATGCSHEALAYSDIGALS
jgi:hypothetical protein